MIQISQSPYIERVLTGKEWLNLNCIGSPLDTHMKYNLDLPELDEKEKNEYLELVGSTRLTGPDRGTGTGPDRTDL